MREEKHGRVHGWVEESLGGNKCQGDQKNPHSHTIAPLVKDGSGLQLMHSLKCQDVQTRVPQLHLMSHNYLFHNYLSI